MATTYTVAMRTAKFLPLSGGKVRKIKVANSQTLAVNDFVILASGLVTVAAAAGATASDVYGITQDAVSNSGTGSTTYVNVRVIEPSSRFIGNYADGTTDTAVATQKTTTLAQVGIRHRLQKLDGKWCLSAQTAATDTVGVAFVTAIANEDPVGCTGGRVIFKIAKDVLE